MKKIILAGAALMLSLMLVSCKKVKLDMVKIPGRDIKMLKTEVTQELYKDVMGFNPSYFQPGSKFYEKFEGEPYVITRGEDPKKLPVEEVSWYDAIYFCNKLSVMNGLEPVYAVDGNTKVAAWGYEPNKEPYKWNRLYCGEITQNLNANGYRLPTKEEWVYAAKGGRGFVYAGSDDLDKVGWYDKNSDDKTHTVALKKPNDYGLYDMSGNVWEWCWDFDPYGSSCYRYYRGGCYNYYDDYCKVGDGDNSDGDDYCEVDPSYFIVADFRNYSLGFRIVCSASK